MLNIFTDHQAAAETRMPFGEGAFPQSSVRTVQPRNNGVVFARPRAFWAADMVGQYRSAAEPIAALRQYGLGKQHPHTTRLIAPSDGAKGPHPAREPV